MIDTSEYYGGTYPEPNWCYEDEKQEEVNEDEYEAYIADEYHELEMLGMLD